MLRMHYILTVRPAIVCLLPSVLTHLCAHRHHVTASSWRVTCIPGGDFTVSSLSVSTGGYSN